MPHDKYSLSTLICRGVHLKTLNIRNYIINNCFFRLFMDLIIYMIHMLNILTNSCNFLLPTCGCCEPSLLGPSSASRHTSLHKALPRILPKARPKPLILTIIYTLIASLTINDIIQIIVHFHKYIFSNFFI